MSRFYSAAAVCALCFAMTGSADAAVRVTTKLVGPHCAVHKQTTTCGARPVTIKKTVIAPHGVSKTVIIRK